MLPGFRHDDPLVVSVAKAWNETHESSVRLHYLSCSLGVGRQSLVVSSPVGGGGGSVGRDICLIFLKTALGIGGRWRSLR